MSTLARRRVGLLSLPDELVSLVLAYGDLRARFACVAASSQLRDAQGRMSPAHEHRLLVRQFPILKPLLDANKTLAPAEIYRSQQKMFHSELTQEDPMRTPMDAYTFYVEVKIKAGNRIETIYVGAGTLGTISATVSFPIPAEIWARQHDEADIEDIKISAMVSRAIGGSVECAHLFQGDYEDGDGTSYFIFGSHPVPSSPAAACLQSAADCETTSYAVWLAPESPHTHEISVRLEWNHEHEMTVVQARHMLEFLDWSRM